MVGSEAPAPESPEGSEAPEELYEWLWDRLQNKWIKITAVNSQGRRCDHCGCGCPCACADCLYQCCS